MSLTSNSELTSTLPPSIKLKILRTFNLLSFLLVFFSNSYFMVFSGSSGEINHKYPTYFTPSLTFVGIFWFILHILQLGFAFVAQFSNLRIVQDVVENAVSWWFTFSNLFLCGQLFFLVSYRISFTKLRVISNSYFFFILLDARKFPPLGIFRFLDFNLYINSSLPSHGPLSTKSSA